MKNVKLSMVETQNTENSIEENAVETSVYNAETSTCEAVEAVARNDGGGASGSIVDDVGTNGENAIQRAARRYRQAGLNVLPACDKRPAFKTWRQFQKEPCQTPIKEQIKQLAIICGAASGNVEVIDFDFAGEDYENWRKEVVRLGGDIYADVLDALVIERTQSGGYHVAYRIEGESVDKSQNLTTRVKTFDSSDVRKNKNGGRYVKYMGKNINVDDQERGVYCTIETRAEGAVVIVAPSLGSKPSTKYESIQNDWANIQPIPKEIREILIQAARNLSDVKPDQKPTKNPRDVSSVSNVKRTPSTASNFPSIVYQFKEPTNGDDSASSILRANPEYIVERLEAHGNKIIERLDDKIQFNRATSKKFPKLDFTLFVDAQTGEAGALYSFDFKSTPFEETNRGYSPLEVVALLDFYGDESAASSAVCEAYNAQIGKNADYKNCCFNWGKGTAQGTTNDATNEATENKEQVETTDDDDDLETFLRTPTIKEFPLDVLPKILRGYVMEISKTKKASVGTCVLMALPVLSAIIGQRARIDTGDLNFGKCNCNVSTFLVADSGEGKTDLAYSFKKPFEDKQIKREENWSNIRRRIAEGKDERYKTKKEINAALKNMNEVVDFLPTDVTVEALDGIIKYNQSVSDELCGTLLDVDEGAQLLELGSYSQGKGGGRETATLIKLLNGSRSNKHRVTSKSSFVHNPFLAIIGGFQPKILADLIKTQPNLIEQGCIARFNWTYEPPVKNGRIPHRGKLDQKAVDDYQRIFDEVNALNDEQTFVFSDDAMDLLFSYIEEKGVKAQEFKDDGNVFLKQVANKSSYTVTHTALIIHFLKWLQRNDETLPENEKVKSDSIKQEAYRDGNDEENATNGAGKPEGNDAELEGNANDDGAEKNKWVYREVPYHIIDADTVRRAIEIARYSLDAAIYTFDSVLNEAEKETGLKSSYETIERKVLEGVPKAQKKKGVGKTAYVWRGDIARTFNQWNTKAQGWTEEKQFAFLKMLCKKGKLEKTPERVAKRDKRDKEGAFEFMYRLPVKTAG